MDRASTSIFDLSDSEKLQLVQDLWDELAANPQSVPVHEWQVQEIEKRHAALQTAPTSALLWDDVKRRVRSRDGR